MTAELILSSKGCKFNVYRDKRQTSIVVGVTHLYTENGTRNRPDCRLEPLENGVYNDFKLFDILIA